MSGAALRMRLELSRRGIVAAAPEIVPLGPAVKVPMYFEGIAVPISVDKENTKFRPWAVALPWMLRQPPPPLLWRHREPAGRIERLWHDERGQLMVRAFVTDERALRAAHWSICATVRAYRMHQDHAEIMNCEIVECSITDRPANSDAKILHRYPAVDYDDTIVRLKRCAEMVKEMTA